MDVLGYCIVAFLAFVIGIFAENRSNKHIGTLIVDRSNREEPYLYLQLDDPDWYKMLSDATGAYFRVRFKD